MLTACFERSLSTPGDAETKIDGPPFLESALQINLEGSRVTERISRCEGGFEIYLLDEAFLRVLMTKV